MVGCCKFGPFKKKRTYEFNNPPYTANKQSDVYHSHKHNKFLEDQGANVNGSTSFQEYNAKTNSGFENEAGENLQFNGATAVDLDSECHSLADEKNHKTLDETGGFKSVGLVAASEGLQRKDSKRSSKSSKSSKSSSSSSSRRSSNHSLPIEQNRNSSSDRESDHVCDHEEVNAAIVEIDTIETEVYNSEQAEEIINEEVSENVDEVTQNEAEAEAEGDVDEVEVEQSAEVSVSTDAHSYQAVVENINQATEEEEVVNEENEASVTSEDNSSGILEAPPGLEELDNAANDMVQEGSYDVSEEIAEISVNAHGDDSEHVENEIEELQ